MDSHDHDHEQEASVLATYGESNDWKSVDDMPADPYCDIIKTLKSTGTGSSSMWTPFDLNAKSPQIPFYLNEWKYFIASLKKKAKYIPIEFPVESEEKEKEKSSLKNKKKNHESASEIIERKDRERSEKAIDSVHDAFIDEHRIKPNVDMKYMPHVSVFHMIKWVIELHRHIEDHYHASIVDTLLDGICSISRMRKSISHYPEYILAGIDHLISAFQSRFEEKITYEKSTKARRMKVMSALFANERLFIESTWEKSLPFSRDLYIEQKEVYNYVCNALKDGKNEPLLLGYKVSPSAGKTFLSAILGALIENGQQMNRMDEKLTRAVNEGDGVHLDHVPRGTQKILLYSCYNIQVRNMVSGLCRDADVPFWVASSYMKDGVIRTTLRPFKTLYEDFRAYRKSRGDPMRHGTLDEQWLYNLDFTNRDPAIIIADPESCSALLDAYPERFVGYFDEITAGAEEGEGSAFARHTCELLKRAPRQTILLSATLQSMDQLEWCSVPFMERHSKPLEYKERTYQRSISWKSSYVKEMAKIRRMDYMNLYSASSVPIIAEVQSQRLNISCSVYVPDNTSTAYISYMPHMRLSSVDQLGDLITKLERDNALMRMYSPEAVFYMMVDQNAGEFNFDLYFQEYGLVKHQTVRTYIFQLFRHIYETRNVGLFEHLRTYRRTFATHMDQSHILTHDAHIYNSGKVIQVSTSSHMPEYICAISRKLLEGSPTIHEILQKYKEEYRILEEKLSALSTLKPKSEGSGSFKVDTKEVEERKMDIMRQYAPKIKYPRRHLVNSAQHAAIFAPSGAHVNDSVNVMLSKDSIQSCVENGMEDDMIKLYMSGVAIRDILHSSQYEKTLYERSIRVAKFFISDPSIVYGTNIKHVNSISITSEYAASAHSTRNSIYQLMGRAGRSGQSDSARIIFHSMEGVEKLFGDENYEARVMRNIAQTKKE